MAASRRRGRSRYRDGDGPPPEEQDPLTTPKRGGGPKSILRNSPRSSPRSSPPSPRPSDKPSGSRNERGSPRSSGKRGSKHGSGGGGGGGRSSPTSSNRRRRRAKSHSAGTSGGGNGFGFGVDRRSRNLIDSYESDADHSSLLAHRDYNSDDGSSYDGGGRVGCAGFRTQLRHQLELEKDSETAHRIREGCVTPVGMAVRDTLEFVRVSAPAPVRGLVGGGRNGHGRRGDERNQRSGSTSDRKFMDLRRGVMAEFDRDAPIYGNGADGMADDNYDEEDEEGVDRGTDSDFFNHRSPTPQAGQSANGGEATSMPRYPSNPQTTDGGGPSSMQQQQRQRRPYPSIQERVDRQNELIEAISQAERAKARARYEREKEEQASMDSPGRDGNGIHQPRGSPRGVASPDKSMREQYTQQQQRSMEVIAQTFSDVDVADAAGGSGVNVGDNGEYPQIGNGGNNGNGNNVFPPPTSSGGAGLAAGMAAAEGGAGPGAGAGGAEAEAYGGGEEMRNLRLALFEGSIVNDYDDDDGDGDGGPERTVPLSRLKRAMGELVLQDDVIESLRVELEAVRGANDELVRELDSYRKREEEREEEAAAAAASPRSNDGNDDDNGDHSNKGDIPRGRDVSEALRRDLEREQMERIRLQQILIQEESTFAENKAAVGALNAELGAVRGELQERIDEEGRREEQRRKAEQLRERAAVRRGEEMERLREEVDELRRIKFAPPSLSREGVAAAEDGGGGDASVMTYPPATTTRGGTTAADKSARNAADSRPESPSRAAAEELSHRAEMIDLKLRLSDAEAKAKEEIVRLVEQRSEAEEKIGRLTSDLDAQRAASDRAEEGRRKAEEELERLRQAEGSLRKANDILRARLQKSGDVEGGDDSGENEKKEDGSDALRAIGTTSRGIGGGLVNANEAQVEELRKKDEEIETLRGEVERLTSVLPDLNRQIVDAKKKSEAELSRSRDAQSALQAEMKMKDEEISRLHKEADRLTNVLPDLNRQVLGAKEKSQAELSKSREMQSNLQSQLQKKDEEVATLRSEVERLSDVLPDLNRQIVDAKKMSEDELSKTKAAQSNLETKLQKKDEEIESLRSEVDRLMNATSDLNMQIRDARNEANDELSKIREAESNLKRQVVNLTKDIVKLESDVVEAKSDSDDEAKLRKEAEDQIIALNKKLAEAEGSRSEMGDALIDSTAHSNALRAEIDELKALLGDAEDALNTSREEIHDVRLENEDMKLMLDEADKSASLVEREIQASVEADTSLRVELESMQELLKETESEAKATKAKLEEEVKKVKEETVENMTRAALEQAKVRDEAEAALKKEVFFLKAQLASTEASLSKAEDQLEEEVKKAKEETIETMSKEIKVREESEAALQAELSALKSQMLSAEALLHKAKDQHEVEWKKQKELEGLLQTQMRVLTKKLAVAEEKLTKAQERLKAEADLSVTNVSLRSEVTELKARLDDEVKLRTSAEVELKKRTEIDASFKDAVNNSLRSEVADLKARLADSLTELTTLEDDLRQRLEVEAELRDAVEILRKRCAGTRGVFRTGNPDDVLDAEMNSIQALLSSLSNDELLNSLSSDEDAADNTAQQGEATKREIHSRLQAAEEARCKAEKQLESLKSEMTSRLSDSEADKVDLEQQVIACTTLNKKLRGEMQHFREQLQTVGVKVGSPPHFDTKPGEEERHDSKAMAKEILQLNEHTEGAYKEEIDELKILISKVVEKEIQAKESQKSSFSEAWSVIPKDERLAQEGLQGKTLEQLHSMSNQKLEEANADLKTLLRTKDDMRELQKKIRSKCEAILAIHEANAAVSSGKWEAPQDEVVGTIARLDP